jgi:hypothetical protein
MKFSDIVALKELSWISIRIFEMFNFREVMNQSMTRFLHMDFDRPVSIIFMIEKRSMLIQVRHL